MTSYNQHDGSNLDKYVCTRMNGKDTAWRIDGVEYTTRSSAKKALSRKFKGGKNRVRARNTDRLQTALRNIILEEGIDVAKEMREMAAAKAQAMIQRLATPEDMVRDLIQEQVARVFGSRFASPTGRASELKEFIDKTIRDEVKKQLLDHLNIDLRVGGHVFTTGKPLGRAMELEDHLDGTS